MVHLQKSHFWISNEDTGLGHPFQGFPVAYSPIPLVLHNLFLRYLHATINRECNLVSKLTFLRFSGGVLISRFLTHFGGHLKKNSLNFKKFCRTEFFLGDPQNGSKIAKSEPPLKISKMLVWIVDYIPC